MFKGIVRLFRHFVYNQHEGYSLVILIAATAVLGNWVKGTGDPGVKLLLIMFVAIASIPVYSLILAPYGTWLSKHFSMSAEWQSRVVLGVLTVLLAAATAMGNAFATGSILLSTSLPASDFPHALYVLTVIYTTLWFAYFLSIGFLVPSTVALILSESHKDIVTAFCALTLSFYAALFGSAAFINLLDSNHRMLNYVITSSSFVENQGSCTNLKPYVDISPLSDNLVVAELPDSYVLAPCKRAEPPSSILNTGLVNKSDTTKKK